nr:MAG TPA: hypothetical protein [Caudoviricetes sp.]
MGSREPEKVRNLLGMILDREKVSGTLLGIIPSFFFLCGSYRFFF